MVLLIDLISLIARHAPWVLQPGEWMPAIRHFCLLALVWMANNPVQVFGMITGVGGALLLALRCRFSPYAWPIWIASNAAWTYYAMMLHEPAYALIVQQIVFGVINVLGTWRWLFAKKVEPAAAR